MSQHESIKPELKEYESSIEGLRQTGHQFWTRGWSLGTSSNYSAVVGRDPLRLLVTASGKDKGHLGPNDFVVCDELGKSAFENQPKSMQRRCSIAWQPSVERVRSFIRIVCGARFYPIIFRHWEGFASAISRCSKGSRGSPPMRRASGYRSSIIRRTYPRWLLKSSSTLPSIHRSLAGVI